MIILLAYLHARYVILLSMVTHVHLKLMNTFGNLLPQEPCVNVVRQVTGCSTVSSNIRSQHLT